jgi:hypothetical protein
VQTAQEVQVEAEVCLFHAATARNLSASIEAAQVEFLT